MNFQLPMLALLAANRFGDSPGDSGRAALLAMTIRPPMVGLLAALMLAKQKAPKNAGKPDNGGSPTSGGGTGGGGIIERTIPRIDRSFLPSFIDESRKQAEHFAKELGLNATFRVPEGLTGKGVVVNQEPRAGAPWPRDLKEVILHLG